MEKIRHIAVLVTSTYSYSRQILRGIHQYFCTKRDWELRRIDVDINRVHVLRDWHTDGIICHYGGANILRAIAALHIPAVNTSARCPELLIPRVVTDDKRVGQLAAEYYINLGFRNCAFYGTGERAFAEHRRESFIHTLAENGSNCAVFHAPHERIPVTNEVSLWQADEEIVYAWLRELPKPVGILTASDGEARYLAEVCLHRHIRVPREVAIMGVDDDDLECLMAVPPLSSVRLSGESVGYEASRLLDRMLNGEAAPTTSIDLAPMGIVARASTDTLAVSDPDVANALRFIYANADKPIRVDDVLMEIPLSRRVLEARFRRVLGRTLLEGIIHAHVELAKKLLADGSLPIPAVATKAGFRSINSLYTSFKTAVGTTPATFRTRIHRR